MKIKGISSGKDKKVPRGTVIEYTPEEKVPLAVMDAFKTVEDDRLEGILPLVLRNDVTVEKVMASPRGTSLGKPFQNNSYVASGGVTVWPREVKTDVMRPKKSFKYKIKFEDCCDHLGQPDLKITEFNLN